MAVTEYRRVADLPKEELDRLEKEYASIPRRTFAVKDIGAALSAALRQAKEAIRQEVSSPTQRVVCNQAVREEIMTAIRLYLGHDIEAATLADLEFFEGPKK